MQQNGGLCIWARRQGRFCICGCEIKLSKARKGSMLTSTLGFLLLMAETVSEGMQGRVVPLMHSSNRPSTVSSLPACITQGFIHLICVLTAPLALPQWKGKGPVSSAMVMTSYLLYLWSEFLCRSYYRRCRVWCEQAAGRASACWGGGTISCSCHCLCT